MLDHESLFAGMSVYGVGALFAKAWLIVLFGQSLYVQCEFSPASIRHSIWMAAVLGLFTLPVLTLLLPAWSIPFFTIEIAPLQTIEPETSNAVDILASAFFSLNIIIIIYLSVSLVRLSRLVLAIVEIASITSKAHPAGECWQRLQIQTKPWCRYQIKISAQIKTPLTWGFLSPVVIVPERSQYWTERERIMVLQHECSHIDRADWLIQLLGQIVYVLYWPVPGIQRSLEKLSLEAEQACDDRVLGQGVNASDYAHLLLRLAKINKLQATVGFAEPSEFARRVRHIISATVNRTGEQRMKSLLLALSISFMFPFASFQATASLPQGTVLIEPINLTKMLAFKPEVILHEPWPPIQRPNKPIDFSGPPAINIDEIDNTSMLGVIGAEEIVVVDIAPIPVVLAEVSVELIAVNLAK